LRWLLAGASGFLGSALRVRLAEQGDEVVRLVRREPATATEYRWDPDRSEIDRAALDGVDVVVNLCGAGVADRPWTPTRRELLRRSRVNPTGTLAGALADSAQAGGSPVLIQAGGIAIYGTHHTAVPHTEDSPLATDFLAQVVRDWEQAADPAVEAGVRTVFMRTSPVLDAGGGSFRLMKLAWSLGGGAVLGDGRQRMPMISLHDFLRFVLWAAQTPSATGPYNLTIPEPTTNAEFSDTLAAQLKRPRILKVPAGLLRIPLGELAEQLVGDLFAVPRRPVEQGFVFDGPDVAGTVRLALARQG
jgi:uncharacterized protein